MEWIWASLFVIFVVAEIATVQLISIWFSLGALAALVSEFFGAGPVTQIVIFSIVSAVTLAISFPLIRKRMKTKKPVATNADRDIGKTASVIEEINFDKDTGRVTLSGVDWKAVPANKTEIIPVGSIVTVKEVYGAKLIVASKTEIHC